MVNLMPENPGVIIGEPRHVTIVILDDDSKSDTIWNRNEDTPVLRTL